MEPKYYLKLITGFRDDQFVSVPMQEAHKAYFLFRNPEQRGVFENGVALVGSSIKEIHPDYNATMGWNPDHKLNADDYNEINSNGIGQKMSLLIEKAKEISDIVIEKPELLRIKLGEILKNLPQIEAPKHNNLIEELAQAKTL